MHVLGVEATSDDVVLCFDVRTGSQYRLCAGADGRWVLFTVDPFADPLFAAAPGHQDRIGPCEGYRDLDQALSFLEARLLGDAVAAGVLHPRSVPAPLRFAVRRRILELARERDDNADLLAGLPVYEEETARLRRNAQMLSVA